MKKLLYACASILCLALAVSVLVLSGAAGLRLLTDGAVNGVANGAAGALQTESVNAPKAAELAEQSIQVYIVDFDRLMKDSLSGQAVSAYAEKYTDVMQENLKGLNAALKDKKKKYNVSEVKKLIEQFTRQKNSVWDDARTIIRGLVRSAAASSPLKDALLVDQSAALYLPVSFDRTADVIACIDQIKLNLPEVPKPIQID